MWQIVYSKSVAKQLEKMPREVSVEIKTVLQNYKWFKVPSHVGILKSAMTFWPVVVGDYRVLCHTKDEQKLVEVIKINRK